MSKYINLFNTIDEYNTWASAHTDGLPAASYILLTNQSKSEGIAPYLSADIDEDDFTYASATTKLNVKSNQTFSITKPDWVIMDASGAGIEHMDVVVAKNSGETRSGNIVITYGSASTSIAIVQNEEPVPLDEIWYWTSDGSIVNPYIGHYSDFGDANVVSNTYDEKGIIKLDKTVTKCASISNNGNLLKIKLPDSISSLSNSCFRKNPALTTVIFGSGLTFAGNGTFTEDTALVSFVFPNTITEIGNNIFKGCTALSSVTIPTSVTELGGWMFSNTPALTSLNYLGTIAQWNAIGGKQEGYWKDGSSLTKIHCSDGDCDLSGNPIQGNNEIWYYTSDSAVTNLNTSTGWGANFVSNTYADGKGIIKFDGDITTIPEGSFMWAGNLSTFTIPDSVTRIENAAFRITYFTALTIPVSVTYIGGYAFDAADITALDYAGTMAQWNAISKGGWNVGGNVTVVHCSDGDVSV